MKKQVFLLFAALVFCQAVFAYDFSAVAPSGQTLFYNIVNGNAQVTFERGFSLSYYTYPAGVLVIPDTVTYNGTTYSVTSIGNSAFNGCSGLTSVTIPNPVTSIGQYAFYNCSGLTSVAFNADSCTYMGNNSYPVFYGCTNLTSLSIGNNVKVIPNYAFYGCSGLTSVTIPNSVTSIGEFAFYNCSGLTSVTIPNSVTSIRDYAFQNCSGLTMTNYTGTLAQWCTINFSNNANPVAFSHNLYINGTEVTQLVIPNGVTEIKQYAFSGCSGLTGTLTIPNSVTSIGSRAFSGCSGLTGTLTIPNSVTSIRDYAFQNCSGLTSVTIPNPVTSIGQYAFYNCSGLTSVTIPNSVTSIHWGAFKGCSGLTSVTISNSVTSIGEQAFYGCSGLTSVTIPNSVTSIGSRAFSGCSGLQELTFLNPTPPQFGADVFEGVPSGIPVNVPCGGLALYYARLLYFNNFVELQFEFSAVSEDENKGTVQVLTEPTCTNHNAVVYAQPASGYRFDHWSTGSTDNPYSLTVVVDTVITAYFVLEGDTQGIEGVERDDMQIIVSNGHIVVEGVEQKDIHVYDITGRTRHNHALPSGVYIVKIGQLPARKVVVLQ